MANVPTGGGGEETGTGTPTAPENWTGDELIKRWARGDIRWKDLSTQQRTYIRNKLKKYASSHPKVFSGITGNVEKMTANQIISAVNKGTTTGGTTGGTKPGGGDDDDDGKPSSVKGLPKGYRVVKYKGKAYVVYDVKLKGPSGSSILSLGWTLTQDQAKKLGINWNKIKEISASEFKKLELGWGGVEDILNKGLTGDNPLQHYLRDLYDMYGRKASWLQDKEVMERYLMCYLEGITDPTLIAQYVSQTAWGQHHTDAQKNWELMTRAEKRATIDYTLNNLRDALLDMYGPNFDWADIGLSNQELRQMAEDISSGKYGDPEMGWEQVISDLRKDAEEVEGSAAWISVQTEIQESNAFMNEPENMLYELTQQAIQWLGPLSGETAMLSQDTLTQWAEDLVSGVKSEADWNSFLQQTASSIYPWLPANTPWQQAVDPYRALAEAVWGRPVPWESPILQKVAGLDEAGKPTGGLLDFLSFEKLLRQEPEFWTSETAQDEGWEFLARLDNIFHGVI